MKHNVSMLSINCVISLSVDECVRLVSKSTRPVIILGSQSTLPPVPADQLRQALEVKLHYLCCFCDLVKWYLTKLAATSLVDVFLGQRSCAVSHGSFQFCFSVFAVVFQVVVVSSSGFLVSTRLVSPQAVGLLEHAT